MFPNSESGGQVCIYCLHIYIYIYIQAYLHILYSVYTRHILHYHITPDGRTPVL